MMSKPGFSFGLKKAAPPKNPVAKRRKPATFSGDDDESDDDTRKPSAAIKEMRISELSSFEIEGAVEDSSTSGRKPKPKKGAPPPPPPSKPSKPSPSQPTPTQLGNLSSALESRKHAEAAEAADPSIYDYDAVYDSLKAPKKQKTKEDIEKRPKYFDALQKAADVRERDRLIAEEKRLKREREAEGDEFADKEKFVTEAYKRQQEENRRLEEEEKRREAAEAERNKSRGLAEFYKQMLDKGEEEHAAKLKAVEEGKTAEPPGELEGEEDKVKTATERAREINALGGNIIINDDGEVVDKRQLLKGGLNVAPKKKVEVQQDKARQEAAAARAGAVSGGQPKGVFATGGKNAMRERQTRMLEAQLMETLKRSREEEEKEKEKTELVAKSRKTEADISSAKERYLARKRAAEEARRKAEEEGGEKA
ncbi:coiled-coil domain-containing protein 55-domain containing protein [Bombardia bombarda]|uniref:Coiled-coil domain-containing protein 55-domain containing protein n=1 Tax=Bombardia bombarda TaxID=252184 RepID=A0AA39WTE5_9PEZI|nr:coiled-coil domain-containing protein 55-domain containing protein [Bombardia bombarda]